MRWRCLWWAWCVLVTVTVTTATSGAGGSAVSVSCTRPTRLSACGLQATLLPPPTEVQGAGAGCATLCAGRALLEWAPGRWSPCAPLTAEEGGACASAWGPARVLLRCGADRAHADVSCEGHRRVRRDEEAEDAAAASAGGGEEAEGKGEEAAATEIAPVGYDAGADAGAEAEADAGDAPASDGTAEPPTEAPAAAGPEEEAAAAPADPTEEAPAEAGTDIAPAPVDPPEDATTPLAPGDGDGDGDGGGEGASDADGAVEAEAEPSGPPGEAPHEWESTLTIVLGALVAVLLVGVAVGGFVLWRWRRRGQALGRAGERAPGDGAEEKPLSRRVAASALEAYVADALRSEELRDQHALLPRGCVRPALCGRRPENRRRNRYNDLVAYDETRVVLLPFPGEDALASDYINANYVDGYARAKEFIAAQAPTAATAADWWRLVWQERVRVVVALCALREAGLEKCFQYWPSAGGAAAHGPVAVTCAREDAFPDFVVRELRAARGDQTRQVVQVQFTAWPDHGVPRHPEAVTALLRRVARLRAAAAARARAEGEGAGEGAGEGPLLVHCSAGVGRTGTVLLALQALEQARAEGAVDMLALLQQLRRQRPNLVDSPEQYEAAHRILVDALLGAPLALAADAALGARVREAAASGELRAQWRRLEPWAGGDAPPSSSASASSLPAASPAASSSSSPPSPPLLELDGFRARARFAAAPAASPASAWRQVVARGLRVAVLLQDPPEGEGPWPADPATADVGVRVVDADARVSVLGPPPAALLAAHGDVLEQRLELRAAGVEGRSLRLLRSRARWPASADVPEGGARPLLRLLRAANAAANAAATSAAAAARASAPAAAAAAPEPVLLLCADGRRGCGLLAALSALLEQLQTEGECCVAEAVHAVRRTHDQLICSEEQLLFLYEAAVAFVEDSLVAGNPR